MEILNINKSQLGNKIGEICTDVNYKGNTVIGYMGDFQIRIKTKMCQSDWDKMCNCTLSKKDITRLKLCGII